MNLSAQITLDLPNTNDEQRKKFYEVLNREKWSKISDLTTTWKVSFTQGAIPDKALELLKKHLDAAAAASRAKYTASIALGFEPIKVSG